MLHATKSHHENRKTEILSYIFQSAHFFLPNNLLFSLKSPFKTSTFFFIHFQQMHLRCCSFVFIFLLVCFGHGLFAFHSKNLTWRDVQHVIIRSSRPDPDNLFPNDWITNSAGLTGMFCKGRYVRPSYFVLSFTCKLLTAL